MGSGHGVDKPDLANHPGRQVGASMRDKLVGQPGLGPLESSTDSWNFQGGAMAYYEPGKVMFHQSAEHPAITVPEGRFNTLARIAAPAIGMAEGLKLQAAAHEHARVKKKED